MWNSLGFGWICLTLAGLLLVAACGSDDPKQVETPPSLAVAQEDIEPIDSATAELIYREAVTAVRTRHAETGEYIYLNEDIKLVEQSLELKPGYLKAMEVLAWVYSTYPTYVDDDSSHETALEYALEVFRVNGEVDAAAYEILAAAYYSNGQLTLGDQFFDHAIERARDDETAEFYRLEKESLQELHKVKLAQP
jgi:tetratricopeptide (TPR) repeat protein